MRWSCRLLRTLLVVPLCHSVAGQQYRPLRALEELRIPPERADLTTVAVALTSPSGALLLVLPEDNTIKVFSTSGDSRQIGRKGEGPGEFMRVARAGWLGDSLWVSDVSLRRLSIYSSDYRFVRSFPYPATIAANRTAGPSVGSAPVLEDLTPHALFPDGSLRMNATLSRRSPLTQWAKGVDSGSTQILRVGANGLVQERITVIPPSPCIHRTKVSGKPMSFAIPFCVAPPTTLWDGSGDMVTVTVGADPGSARQFRVTVRSAEGKERYSRSYPFDPVRIPATTIDSVRAAKAASLAANPAALAAFRKVPIPTAHAPVRRVVAGRDGTVWLEIRSAAPGHLWLLLDRRGEPVGTLSVPAAISLVAGNLTSAWGLEMDADEAQGVVRYRIVR